MRKRAWRWGRAVALAVAAASAAGCFYPSLDDYARYTLSGASGGPSQGQVRVTFLGVATVLIDDGTTALMTDGFFSRPGKVAVALGTIAPDRDVIARSLRHANVTELDAVLVVHSHYDHAMDAPEVARRTGAEVVGSPSTANVALGWNLPEDRIRRITPGEPIRYGAFTVTFLRSSHVPHGMAMGEIKEPLKPPVCATAYKEGGSYAVLIQHALGSVLVNGSAGWAEGALKGRRADVVLLGIGLLGKENDCYRETYYNEVVATVGARCIIPIHYDDFTVPLALDAPLRPMPYPLDKVGRSLRFLEAKARNDRIGLGMLPLWKPVPLFGEHAVQCLVPGAPS